MVKFSIYIWIGVFSMLVKKCTTSSAMNVIKFLLHKHWQKKKGNQRYLPTAHTKQTHEINVWLLSMTWMQQLNLYLSLGKFSRWQHWWYFIIFSQKISFSRLFLWRQFVKWQYLFSGKSSKNISKCQLLKYSPSKLCINQVQFLLADLQRLAENYI